MSKEFPSNSGESDPNKGKFVALNPKHVAFTEDGTITSLDAYTAPGMEVGESKEIIAEGLGIGVSDINVYGVDGVPYLDKTAGTKIKKSSAAFSSSKWNSPWDPQADKKPKGDPSQN